MKNLLLAAILLVASITLFAQQTPPKTNNQQLPKRNEIGKDKPRLFSSTNTSAAKQRTIQPATQNISAVINKAFNTAKPGDTLLIPFQTNTPLKAVVVANQRKSPHITVMNLKVINYQNAFMRLSRNTNGGKTQFQGLVHHPNFADALSLQTKNDSVTFQLVDQAKLVNE